MIKQKCPNFLLLKKIQHGVIISENEEYFIEPQNTKFNTSDGQESERTPHVVYKQSSLQHSYMDATCGVLGMSGAVVQPTPGA